MPYSGFNCSLNTMGTVLRANVYSLHVPSDSNSNAIIIVSSKWILPTLIFVRILLHRVLPVHSYISALAVPSSSYLNKKGCSYYQIAG